MIKPLMRFVVQVIDITKIIYQPAPIRTSVEAVTRCSVMNMMLMVSGCWRSEEELNSNGLTGSLQNILTNNVMTCDTLLK
jgi:hypothetical protein